MKKAFLTALAACFTIISVAQTTAPVNEIPPTTGISPDTVFLLAGISVVAMFVLLVVISLSTAVRVLAARAAGEK